VAHEVAPPDTASRDALETGSHDLPVSPALAALMREGWAEDRETEVRAVAPADRSAARRERLSGLLPGARLVVPAGRPARRGNGQEHRFRPASDYVYLSGDCTAEGVLVLEPDGDAHTATLFLRPPSGRESDAFFRDYLHGELWVGSRPALTEIEAVLGLHCRPLGELAEVLASPVETRLCRGVDAEVDALVPQQEPYPDGELRAIVSELRLVKDDWEVAQIEDAVAATIRGFEDVARVLPAAVADGGERLVDAAFNRRAALGGSGAAFNSIVAGGAHATTLHWTRNDGPLRRGDVLLLDAGVESQTLYAADLTRTFPLGDRFSGPQRRMLELVNDARDAALAAVRPGRPFRDFHRVAAEVLAEGLADWGLLPVSAAESLRDDSGLHRRYTLCPPGHMLGLDVHDCPHARAETYLDGVLQAGNVLTVEPGLYFQADDLTLPAELRGLGVRVEDDVVVTEDGCRVLSERLPRRPRDVESWIQAVRSE